MELRLHGFKNVKGDSLDKMAFVEGNTWTGSRVEKWSGGDGKELISGQVTILAKVHKHQILLFGMGRRRKMSGADNTQLQQVIVILRNIKKEKIHLTIN